MYQLLCEINEKQILGIPVSDEYISQSADYILHNLTRSSKRSRRAAKTQPPPIKPMFFIPQFEVKKFRLITGELPQTNMLCANHYELEILRVLALWRHSDEFVQSMLFRTTDRLNNASFGHGSGKGDSISTAVSVLRFLSVVLDNSDRWLNELIHNINESPNLPAFFYYCLALSGIDSPAALEAIYGMKSRCFDMLRRGWLIGPAELDRYNILRKYVLKNMLSKLDEYSYLAQTEVFISKADGRCYCGNDNVSI